MMFLILLGVWATVAMISYIYTAIKPLNPEFTVDEEIEERVRLIVCSLVWPGVLSMFVFVLCFGLISIFVARPFKKYAKVKQRKLEVN